MSQYTLHGLLQELEGYQSEKFLTLETCLCTGWHAQLMTLSVSLPDIFAKSK